MSTTKLQDYSLADNDLLFAEVDTRYILRFKDLPDSEKPREKLQGIGPQNLTVAELIAVIWGVGSRKEDVLAMAKRTLKEYGEKAISNELNPQHLATIADIPIGKANQIIAGFELGRRFYGNGQAGRPWQVRTSKQAYQYFKDIGANQKEQLRGIYLNSRYRVVHDEVISIGSLTSNIVHPREVFQPALEHNAVAVIIAHNHPSGRLDPTNADFAITEQLVAAGQILGIELLDHLVITASSYASVLEFVSHD